MKIISILLFWFLIDPAEMTSSDPVPSAEIKNYHLNSRKMVTEFVGRSPCHEVLLQLNNITRTGCQRVKMELVIQEGGACELDMVYVGLGNTKYKIHGKWNQTYGTKKNSTATVYRLIFENQDRPLFLMKGDDNVLFILDNEKNLLVGNDDLSFTLNRKL